ncbi:5'-methylthioadenosine/S-adenosylhomocysteine nucleosidase [Acholeplasma sp. OttesenSCG-928-E16]|nr:5'-methylthioadenosine/S-adenosylhomocysteine nucleosidase [Acholeplasma sp. OttesenSCG-928-E16]
MILIIGAMKSELDRFISSINSKHKVTNDQEIYIGKIKNKKVMISESGIGKVQAAYSLTKILIENKINLIINVGLAGATDSFTVGEVVIIEKAFYDDFDLTAFGYQFGQVPGQPPFYQSDKKVIDKLSCLKKYKNGYLYTKDSFIQGRIHDNEYCVDMEGAALFHVAHNQSIPMISIKVVSDIIGRTIFKEYQSFENDEGGVIIKDLLTKIIEEI